MILAINMKEEFYQDQLQLVNLPSQPTLKKLCIKMLLPISFTFYEKITPVVVMDSCNFWWEIVLNDCIFLQCL